MKYRNKTNALLPGDILTFGGDPIIPNFLIPKWLIGFKRLKSIIFFYWVLYGDKTPCYFNCLFINMLLLQLVAMSDSQLAILQVIKININKKINISFDIKMG